MKRPIILSILFVYFTLALDAAIPIFKEDYVKVDSTSGLNERKKRKRVMLDAGIAHWTGDRFRTAEIGTDLGFGLTVNPGVKFLQIHARYDYATIRTTEGDTILTTDYNGRFISFSTLGFGAVTDFIKKNQLLSLSYSIDIVMVNVKGDSPTFGMGSTVGLNYLIRMSSWDRISMGVSFKVLSRTYNITKEEVPIKEWIFPKKEVLDRDVCIVLGYVFSF